MTSARTNDPASETEPAAGGSVIGVLRIGTFRNLWLASLVSNFGNLVQAVGAAWMMALLTSSEGMVALVQTSVTLPIMVFSLFSGVLADNYDRRKVMLVAQVLMLVLSILLTSLALLGLVTPWLLLAFTFLIGSGTALHNPSWQASVGDLVPRDQVPHAVSANAMGFNVMRSIGPAIGGVIVATLGAGAAFALNTTTYLAMITALWRWKPAEPARRLPREPFRAAIAAGIRYIAMSPHILGVVVRSGLFGIAAVFVQALLPIIVQLRLDGGAGIYGLMLGCFGFGAVMGGTLSPRLRARFSFEVIVRFGFLGTAVCTAVIALSSWVVLTALAMVAAGAFWLNSMALFNTLVQMSSPRWVVGRAVSTFQISAFGGMAIGSSIWGYLTETMGLTIAMAFCVTLLVIGALVGLLLPLRDFAGLKLDPLNRFEEPPVQLDLRQRSGPILIEVEYDIDQDNVTEFLVLMQRRRHSRVRNGAQNWRLLRDLQRPDVWFESYNVPTWVEYVRHHSRRTKEDADVSDLLLGLHKGAVPLKVRRMIERQAVPRRDDAPPVVGHTTL